MRVQKGSQTYPSNSALAEGLRVKLSSGYLVAAGAEDRELGNMDTLALSTDSVGAVIPAHVEGSIKMVANGAITQYSDVYAAADGKISTTLGGNYIGVALNASGADGDLIEVIRCPRGGSPLAYANTAASGAISNTTTETAFDKAKTIAANTLRAGDVLRVRAQGIATSTNSTDTLTVKLYVGSLVIVTTGAVDVANNDIFFIDAVIVIRTIGASGTVVATGTVGLGAEGTVTAKPFKLASSTLDTTAANDVACKATWSVASSSDSCRLDVLTVEKLAA